MSHIRAWQSSAVAVRGRGRGRGKGGGGGGAGGVREGGGVKRCVNNCLAQE